MEYQKLGEIVTIKYGKDHKGLSNGNIPVYGTGGLMRKVDKYLYDKPSVLIPRKGSLNNVMFVSEKFWTVDTMFWTIVNTKIINPKYLYYYLSRLNLNKLNVGSAVPSLTVKILNEIVIPVPKLTIQDNIVKKISVFDRKINLNNQINDNLSKFRELLYMRLIQSSDVKEVKLTELFNIAYGKNIAKSELTKSGTKVFGANGLIGYTQKPSIISAPTVTITSRGSGSGYVSYLNIGNAFLTNNLLYLNENKNLGLSFSYETIKSANPKQFVTGSAQPQLTIKNLSQSLVKIPSDINLVNKFRRQMYPIEEIIKHNSFENEKLEMLKNTLLNKCF